MTDSETAPHADDDVDGDFGEKTDFDTANAIKAAVTHAASDLEDVSVDDQTMDWDTYEKVSKNPSALYEAALAVEDPADIMPPKKDPPTPAGQASDPSKNSGSAKAAPAPPKPSTSGSVPAKPAPAKPTTGATATGPRKTGTPDDLHSKVVPVTGPATGPTVTRSGIKSGPVPVIPNPHPPTSPKAAQGKATPSALPPVEPAPPTPAPKLAQGSQSRPIIVAVLALAIAGLVYMLLLSMGMLGGDHDVEGVASTGGSSAINKRPIGDPGSQTPGAGTTTTSTMGAKPEVIDMKFKERDVKIQFTANAPNVEIMIDGVVQEGPLVVPRSIKQKYQARVSAKGYIPANYVIPADEDRTIHFELEKLR
ncbi:MAG: hypothetical protein HY791_23050 [Deltaproteobacteria bacterium]|nr:hypothetical protein [Deltaproteobacteria bacterium]